MVRAKIKVIVMSVAVIVVTIADDVRKRYTGKVMWQLFECVDTRYMSEVDEASEGGSKRLGS